MQWTVHPSFVAPLGAHQPIHSTQFPGSESGLRLSDRCSSWAKPFPPQPPRRASPLCSVASSVLWLCPNSHLRAYLSFSFYLNKPARCNYRAQMRPPRFRTKDFSTCMGSTTARGLVPYWPKRMNQCCLLFKRTRSAPRSSTHFAAQYPAYGLPCERFTFTLAGNRASLGVETVG